MRARDSVRFAINDLMQAKSEDVFEERLEVFKTSFTDRFPVFVAYFEKVWVERKDLWSKAWRPVSINVFQ